MKRIRITAAVCLLVSALAGCGDDGGTEVDSEGNRQVTIGMLPIVPTAALYAGIDQGFFEDRGIELEVETGQGGAALLPAVMSGDIQFASSNPVSLLTARDQGLEVQAVSHWTSEHETPEESINGVVAAKGSPIQSAKDLAGKTVAINTLKSMGDLTIREAVRQDGGDPDQVKFIELGFPDMPAALAQGNADAVWVPEPFMGSLLAEGNQLVTNPCLATAPGMPTQLIFTSPELAKSDPELVKDMTAALEETLEYAEANPDDVRAHIADVIPDFPEEAAANIRLEAFGTDMREAQLERIGELMKEEGWVENDPDVPGLLGG